MMNLIILENIWIIWRLHDGVYMNDKVDTMLAVAGVVSFFAEKWIEMIIYPSMYC